MRRSIRTTMSVWWHLSRIPLIRLRHPQHQLTRISIFPQHLPRITFHKFLAPCSSSKSSYERSPSSNRILSKENHEARLVLLPIMQTKLLDLISLMHRRQLMEAVSTIIINIIRTMNDPRHTIRRQLRAIQRFLMRMHKIFQIINVSLVYFMKNEPRTVWLSFQAASLSSNTAKRNLFHYRF